MEQSSRKGFATPENLLPTDGIEFCRARSGGLHRHWACSMPCGMRNMDDRVVLAWAPRSRLPARL